MKIVNTALGLLGSRFFGRPFYVRFHTTYRCNYRCGMCGLAARQESFPELGLESIAAIARRLHSLGARHVVITGGEPFLRRDLPGIVQAFSKERFSVRIQTNGGPQVTREALTAVVAAGANDLSVSVDTLDADLQDRICDSRGVLDNAMRTLAMGAELLPRGMTLANIVASRHNFSQLPDLVTYFHERGIYSYITPVMVSGNGSPDDGSYAFRGSDEGFAFVGLEPTERDAVIDSLVRLRRDGAGLTNSTRHLEDFRTFLATEHCRWLCEAGRLSLDVLPDGRCSVCKEKPPMANVLDPDFISTYRSAAFRETAASVAQACDGCFYGEYREPYYAVRDLGVLAEWVRDWLRVFRRGMAWTTTKPS
jgi:MoaA/NifB/PqqE/SkfB family radical SAM enzyme